MREQQKSRNCIKDNAAPYKIPMRLLSACVSMFVSVASLAQALSAPTPGCAKTRALADMMTCTISLASFAGLGVWSCCRACISAMRSLLKG